MDNQNIQSRAQIMSVMIVEKEVIAKNDTKAYLIHNIATKNTVQNKGFGKKLLMLTMDQAQFRFKHILQFINWTPSSILLMIRRHSNFQSSRIC